MNDFSQHTKDVLTKLRSDPSLLEKKCPEMKKKLDLRCGTGQGLGNKCSDQEASFATFLEECGWTNNDDGSATNGLAYKYQANGTQKAIDFQLQYVENSKIAKFVNVDLKHSDKTSIFLNDGTFMNDVLYIISFTRLLDKVKGKRRCPREHVCAIVLGQDVMTPNDKSALEKRFALIKQLNSTKEDLDYLTLYIRNANQFSCKQFTTQFNEGAFKKVVEWIVPSASPTEQEQHSRSV